MQWIEQRALTSTEYQPLYSIALFYTECLITCSS